MSVREFPLPIWPNTPAAYPAGAGSCRWCGELIYRDRGAKKGEVDPNRSWHADCKEQWFLHTLMPVQRRFLINRDGLKCSSCGEAPQAMRRTHSPGFVARSYYPSYEFTPVEHVVFLEVEHTIPLWMVAHLPPEERRRYFGPENITLMCSTVCHPAKTKREAAQRAHGNRLIEKQKPDRQRKGPKMQSRPFGGQSRSMSHPTLKRGFDGKVRPR